MARMGGTTAEHIEDSWARRRLRRAEARAMEVKTEEAWRKVLDLAASCGFIEEARAALAALDRFKPSVPRGSRRVSSGSRVPERATVARLVLRIKSATPSVRIAWIRNYAAARGWSVEELDRSGRIALTGALDPAKIREDLREVEIEDKA